MQTSLFEKDWHKKYSDIARAEKENHEMCFATRGGVMGYVDYFFTYFARYITPNNSNIRVLDVGCGPGIFSRELAEKGFQVDSIDYSESMIKEAAKQTKLKNVRYKVGDVYNIPFSNEYFDIVICLGVLQTVDDAPRALREISTKLKPGGLLIITTLNSSSLVYLVRKLLVRTPSVHYLRYSPSAFVRSLAQNGGFESIHAKGMYIFPGMLSRLTYVIRKLKIYVLLNFLWFICKPLSHSFYIEARKKK